MKRLSIIVLLMFAVVAVAAMADTDKSVASLVDTVAKAKQADIQTRAVLDGKVVRKVADGEYVFSDGTGEIRLQVMNPAQLEMAMADSEATVHVVGHVAQDMMMTQVTADVISIQD